MNQYSFLGCFYVAGTYNGGKVIIGYHNGQLRGQWLTVNRPNFSGYVGADCKGEVTFPDDKIHKLEFDKVLNKIFWGNRKENVWKKGNLLLFEKSSSQNISRKGIFIWSAFSTLQTEICRPN